MKRAFSTLVVVVSLAVFASNAQAVVKAGSACSKVGATSVASGKKYTCVKSGKKLVWNKGVTEKAANKQSASPVPADPVTPTAETYSFNHYCDP